MINNYDKQLLKNNLAIITNISLGIKVSS